MEEASKSKAGVRVAVAGLGLIGEGAALRLLDESDNYVFCGALVNNASKPRPAFEGALITADASAIFEAKPDVIIDALPVGDVGRTLIGEALTRGISVVSANKQAVAGSLSRFHELASGAGVIVAYSASVGGGAPMVETVREAKDHSEIVEFAAILNGTVNYILTALAGGETFEAAVKQAQDAGFAEPDPTADLSGDDARAKIAILSFEAFGEEVPLASVTTEALTPARAAEIVAAGGVWRQISRVTKDENGAITAALSFEQVDDADFFAGVLNEGNALRVKTTDGRSFTCEDKGAGRVPTVNSLFADLDRIAALVPAAKTA